MFNKKPAVSAKKPADKGDRVFIGSAWVKQSKNGEEYISIAFKGKGHQDTHEVIVRDKSSGEELALFETQIYMNQNKKKEKDSQPDFYISALVPQE